MNLENIKTFISGSSIENFEISLCDSCIDSKYSPPEIETDMDAAKQEDFGEQEEAKEVKEEKVETEVAEVKQESYQDRVRAAGGKVLSTPATRVYAKRQGVDIEMVVGTGKGGRVVKEDVDKFLAGDTKPIEVEDKVQEVATGAGTMAGGVTLDPLPKLEDGDQVK
jgi:pyruvate dehydrogenase E2 component (dihydrolipoamide acetyltransferase)